MSSSTPPAGTTSITPSTDTPSPTKATSHTAVKTTTTTDSTTDHATTATTTSSDSTKTVASTMYITTSGVSSIAPVSFNVSGLLATSIPTASLTAAHPSNTPNGVDCSLDSVHAFNGVCNSEPNNSTTNATSSDEQGLSKGAAAGVAVGSITGAAAIIAIAVFMLRRRRRPQKFNRGKGITPSMVFSDTDGSSRFSMFGNLGLSKSPTGVRGSNYSFATPTAALSSQSGSQGSNSWMPNPPSEKTTATIDYYYNMPGGGPAPLIARPPNARQSTRSSAARLSKYNYLAQAFSQMRTSYANPSESDPNQLLMHQQNSNIYNSRDALRAGSVAADSLSQALDETDEREIEVAHDINRDSDVIPSNFNHKKQPRYQMASMYSTFSRDSDIIEPVPRHEDNAQASGFAAMNAPLFNGKSSEAGPQQANQIELSPIVGQMQVSPVVPRITLFNEDNEEEVLADPRIRSGPLDSTTLFGLGGDSGAFRDSFTSEVSHFSTDSNPFRAKMAANNASADAWTQEDGDINKKAIPPSSSTYQYF
ncbi:hypothetical protein Unana1_06272 [Umbelopsis nana]